MATLGSAGGSGDGKFVENCAGIAGAISDCIADVEARCRE